MKFLAVVFLMLLVVLASHEVVETEARTCESKSQRFKGLCSRDTNCGSVCKTEGFTGGDCKGLRRRCFCTRHC